MRPEQRITQITHEPPVQLGYGLSQAFYEEPTFTSIFPDILVRRVALPWFLGRFVVQLGLSYGAVFTANEVDGAAVWLHPNTTIPFSGALRAGMLRLAELPPLHQPRPLPRTCPAAVCAPSALVSHGARRDAILARVDAEQVPCYLETFTERNVQFYGKLGFTVVVHDHIPAGGPPFWTMVRTPQT